MRVKATKLLKLSMYSLVGSTFALFGFHLITSHYHKPLCRSNLKAVLNSEILNKYPSWKEALIRFMLSYNLFPELELAESKGIDIFDRHLKLPFGLSCNFDYSSSVGVLLILDAEIDSQ